MGEMKEHKNIEYHGYLKGSEGFKIFILTYSSISREEGLY